MGVKSWGVLCLGIHMTWRAGGADAGAAASVLEEKGACLERLTRKECPRTCQEPESMLLYRSGLFGPLRSPGRLVLGLEERFFGTWSWFLFCGRKGKRRDWS